jgi:membrane-associated phospholipid phosphatase
MKLLKSIPAVVYVQVMMVLVGYAWVILSGKEVISYTINGLHTPLLNFIGKYFTHLGDGLFAVGLGLLWLFKNKREGFLILLSYGSSAIITQLLKRLVFADALRPIMALDEARIHLVDGVTVHRFNSFPSGHSTTAMAVAMMLYFYLPQRYHPYIFIVANITLLTRVYLLQHYLTDVIAGASIGLVCALIIHLTLSHDRETENH